MDAHSMHPQHPAPMLPPQDLAPSSTQARYPATLYGERGAVGHFMYQMVENADLKWLLHSICEKPEEEQGGYTVTENIQNERVSAAEWCQAGGRASRGSAWMKNRKEWGE